MNTVIIAIVMGIMYWWCRGMILSYFGFLFISSPVTVGLVAGLLMGQPMQGLIIGGGMAYTFLKAKGLEVGKSLVDEPSNRRVSGSNMRYSDRNRIRNECNNSDRISSTSWITRIIRNQFKKSDQHILCSKSK